jgi:hypothetical protein
VLINIPIEKLAAYIEEFNKKDLIDNIEINTENLGLSVTTPTGETPIKNFIKKCNLPMIQIDFNNGYSIKVAKNHILQQNGKDIFAKDLKIGSIVAHLNGNIVVTNLTEIKNDDCFDISIDAPHLYYDSNGLIHHNTILTATLARCAGVHGRTILIVPSKNLVTQTEEDYINVGLDVGVIYGDRKQLHNQHLICTWQSLNSLLKTDPESLSEAIDGVICVMVDECHSLKADKLKSLMTDVFARVPIRWAVTGTIPKEEYDWRALQVCVGEVINRISASELQDRGVLAECNVNVLQLVDHVEFKNYQAELQYLLENSDRIGYIASMVAKLDGNTLVLIDRVDPGRSLAEQIPNAVFLSGSTKVKDRKEQYAEVNFSDGKVIVATYGIAAVGINITKLHNLVLIEPGKSFVRVIQSIGRGLRKGFDKDSVEIWDVTSTCKFSKRHLTKRKQFYAEADYPYAVEKIHWQNNK